MDYKDLIRDEKCWVDESDMQHLPSSIKNEYRLLVESVKNNDSCATMFRLKDIYEICMKLPAIMAIIMISSKVENDTEFIRMTDIELQKKYDDYHGNNDNEVNDSDALKKFGTLLIQLLKEPLSIGGWKELIHKIIEYSEDFEIDESLYLILKRTEELAKVRPRRINGEDGRYEDICNWRNKTIGHGTLLINTSDYWEQAYDLINGLYKYLIGGENKVSLSELYSNISLEIQEKEEKTICNVLIGDKVYPISEYIYFLDNEQYFFDSYYSKQNYTEVTNYFNAPKRLKDNTYYQALYAYFNEANKKKTKKKGRKISSSIDREMFACLKCALNYEKPKFIIDEIKNFINTNDKGILYIQMERGMGKSTLAYRLNGRYQRGFLQKDLNAVVRVYHVSDMLLRGENRIRDYYTALNSNLLAFEGGQLEIDDEDYYIDGKDLRQFMKENENEAQILFCKYLELFRLRYEEEVEDEVEETKLVYIIDGIDELNGDTYSILNTIPNGTDMQSLNDDEMNNVYIILLSRPQNDENLPDFSKKCISICENKANRCICIDGDNDEYYQLLERFILRNYKGLSKDDACQIIENAKRKFLYIQPYMVMGNDIFLSSKEVNAYTVAQNYINSLQKQYCGMSLHTLQLIIAAIALFHSITLKDICDYVLFTEVSYDLIGALNDIFPLLSVTRTDGDDKYSFANEEYNYYVFNNMYEPLYEVVSRFRISLISWTNSADVHTNEFGIQWGKYVENALVIDSITKKLNYFETTEEYIKSLIILQGKKNPHSFYSKTVKDELECDIIQQIRLLGYRELEILTVRELEFVGLAFYNNEKPWHRESKKLLYIYTQEIINHCEKSGKIDQWFELITTKIHSSEKKLDKEDELRLLAFDNIVRHWGEHAEVVDYFYNLIEADVHDNRYGARSYVRYLEKLLDIVDEESLKIRVYEGLVYGYYLLTNWIKNSMAVGVAEQKTDIIKLLKEAERYDIKNKPFIEIIKKNLSNDSYVISIKELLDLANKAPSLSPSEYCSIISNYLLLREKIFKDEIHSFNTAMIKNYRCVKAQIDKSLDENNIENVLHWFYAIIDFKCFSGEDVELVVDYLNTCAEIVKIYAQRNEIRHIATFHNTYFEFLKTYDRIVREQTIGFYSGFYSKINDDRNVDYSQKMTSWEEIYAIYCSWVNEFYDYKAIGNYDAIPVTANQFTDRLLQEYFESGLMEVYYDLNNKIEHGYEILDFRKQYIVNDNNLERVVLEYYKWLCIRYYRSIDGKDERTSDELLIRLKEEYDGILSFVINMLQNDDIFYHGGNSFNNIRIVRELLTFAKMIPDEIISIVELKLLLTEKLDERLKNNKDKIGINELVDKYKSELNNKYSWYNSNSKLIIKNDDRSILDF